ncbi:hypothetical protein [Pseudodesulfovibrio sediminis]|uniref:Uncharacterized protein n=1 Tax=Pseudodesulfovibrio sediminis TaxID=2810563 RepID=A0ABM7P5M4_9BACT|nr:hypothetical protein [Pseudodesulfovibrio sediminis]BCS88228.1 hypothetical protein PSDVSF_14700 [Pseudodesulfovibrio sediminis]
MTPAPAPYAFLKRAALVALFLLPLICSNGWAQEEEYDLDFDIPDAEAEDDSGFDIWGQAELRTIARFLDEDAALYKQKFFNKHQENPAMEFRFQIKPEISWEKGDIGAYVRPRLEIAWSQMVSGQSAQLDEPSEQFFKGDNNWAGQVMAEEMLLQWHPSPSLSFEGGKKVLKWGKGYAWNPVSFISRPKDVNDPDRSREGYYLGWADMITSLDGPITTLAFSPVVSMVSDNINEELARGDSTLIGGKFYMLAYDTDFDVMFMAGDNYDTRLGLDFATNLAENLAIHGELGMRMGYRKQLIDSAGSITERNYNAVNLLLGARYLTETDTTYFVEYYHNGEGYSPLEMRRYYSLIEEGYEAYTTTGSGNLLRQSNKVASEYNASSAGRDYLYLRVSQKEPFDILYLTPTLTTIINLGDGSFTLNPEVSYLMTPTLELKPRLTIPIGPSQSEFGEKVNKCTAELRFTYFY